MANKQGERRPSRGTDRALETAEDAVYSLVGILLFAGALILLGHAAYRVATEIGDSVTKAIQDGLDSLLLVFIFVELLSAIRATLRERKLIAEPFLIVGMIASIKEIVVETSRAKEALEHNHAEFRLAMLEIAILGGLLLVLGVTTYLVRLKEREPEE